MRNFISTFIVLGIMIVVGAIYFFVGSVQFGKRIVAVMLENEGLRGQLAQIRQHEEDIPELEQQVPRWVAQAGLLRRSVPHKIADNSFLANLAIELDRREVQLLEISVSLGGNWLQRLTEEQEAELTAKGIDLTAAKSIRYADYSASLFGEFSDVLMAFESLKGYGRIYTVDSVISPAGAGSGMIMQAVNTQHVPIRLTGRIYYGINPDYIEIKGLEKIFYRAAMRPVVDELQFALGRESRRIMGIGDEEPMVQDGESEEGLEVEPDEVDGESDTEVSPDTVLDARRATLDGACMAILGQHTWR